MKFGPYQIVDKLGTGAMGVVYRAVHEDGGGEVALKILKSKQAASPEAVEQFRNEAKIAASLQHPNIVPIHTFGQADGKYYYTMGFIEGDPLTRLVDDDVLTPEDSVKITIAVADALHYAHGKGVVHSDIKPANILIDTTSRPLISDFGLARQTQGGGMQGALLEGRGTPAYMPPEQAEGREVTLLSDVFSLGAVLYELMTGRPPYEGKTADEVSIKAARGVFPKPSVVNPFIPAALEAIILKAMRKNPADRYQSAEEMKKDLERHLRGEKVGAEAGRAMGRIRSGLMDRRGMAVAAFAAAAFFPFFGPFIARKAGTPPRETIARERIVRYHLDAAGEYLGKNQRLPAEVQYSISENAAAGTSSEGMLEDVKHQFEDNRNILASQILARALAMLKSDDLKAAEEAAVQLRAIKAADSGILKRTAAMEARLAEKKQAAEDEARTYAETVKAASASADSAARARIYRRYLDRHPDGRNAAQIEAEIRKLFPLYMPQLELGQGGKSVHNSKDGAELAFIPAGGFIMGSDRQSSNERPEHKVALDAYYIYKREVTNGSFAKFLDKSGRKPGDQGRKLLDESASDPAITFDGKKWVVASGRESLPVVNVTWFGASEYAAWAGGALPSEAQWEKAARGENGNIYPWGSSWDRNLLNSLSLWAGSDVQDITRWFMTIDEEQRNAIYGEAKLTEAGRFAGDVSVFGCLDMAGNVSEWCKDFYEAEFYSKKTRSPLNPVNDFDTGSRSVRGGGYLSDVRGCRSSFRGKREQGRSGKDLGFRCVLVPDGGARKK